MIKIIDRTLSCLDDFDLSAEFIRTFIDMLIKTGADTIEISEKVFNKLEENLPIGAEFILRLNSLNNISNISYNTFNRLIFHNVGDNSIYNNRLYPEILINDIREYNLISRYLNRKLIRICGLDDILVSDYEIAFNNLKRQFHGKIEFSPCDRLGLATATAIEWVSHDGLDIVTSFGGIGGFASYEEVTMAFRLLNHRKMKKEYYLLSVMSNMFRKYLHINFLPTKAIIGDDIFAIESGIHVDGVLKQPKSYEPYPPELVGNSRKIIIGKNSGKASIIYKLEEYGIKLSQGKLLELLSKSKQLSINQNRALTDDEFCNLAYLVGGEQNEIA